MTTRTAGAIKMRYTKRNNRVVATQLYRQGNCRISAEILREGGIPSWYMATTGGGYTEGETYTHDITLEQDTHVILTTQAATYILKCEHGRETRQDAHITLGENALLEYYPDEIIPYQHAIYRQNTTIDLAPGAALIYMDGVTSGWSPDATPFQYTRLNLHTKVSRAGRLILNDHMIITPATDPVHHMGYYGMYPEFLTVTIIDERVNQSMVERMRDAMAENTFDDTLYGISVIDDGGMVLRILGRSAHINRRVAWRFINTYREQELGMEHIDLRKGH